MNMRKNTGYFLAILLALLCAVQSNPPAQAQNVDFMLAPAVIRSEDGKAAVGFRWGLDLQPEPQLHASLTFPSELWYEVRLNGAAASRNQANIEPLGRGVADFGWRVSLSSQRPFDMQDPGRELQKFDLGYLFAGVQAMAETDQRLEEGIAGLSAVLHYRALGRYEGWWLLVPDLTAGYALMAPVKSELYDAAGIDRDTYRETNMGALWTFRSVYASTPEWFNNLRLAAGVNYYRRSGLTGEAAEVTERSGIYYHADLGYELSGTSRYLNHIFVRYSGGEYPVIYEDRQQWMLGIVF
jgi:hypothetical protein